MLIAGSVPSCAEPSVGAPEHVGNFSRRRGQKSAFGDHAPRARAAAEVRHAGLHEVPGIGARRGDVFDVDQHTIHAAVR
jgi:hypothetical protein